MKHILIITEDVTKIQTLTGFLGRLFVLVYVNWLKLRLQLIISALKPWVRLTVVTGDVYGNELAKEDYAKNRQRHLQITERLLKNYPENLFKNRLAIHLTYNYFIYVQLFERLIKNNQPDWLITLSNSYHEQIAGFLARELRIKTLKLHWLSFIWLNHWLKHFFLKRQFSKRLRQFMKQAQIPVPPPSPWRRATLLSLDFFRHLKTLAPIYQALDQRQLNPWLVTDIGNLEPVLKNFDLESAHYLYLASFLPSGFKPAPVQLPSPRSFVNTINDFLYNLGRAEAAPMIAYGQQLSQLYSAAAKNLFKQIKPKAVAVVSDARFGELALAAAAKAARVSSLLVSPNTLLALDQLNGYDTTDKIAVAGPFIKQQLVNLGIGPDKISVVGGLIFRLNSQKVWQNLGLTTDQKICLLISFGPSQMIPKPEKEAFFRLAAQAVARCPNLVLVVKPHPSEKRHRVLEELADWGITKAVVTNNNQLELGELLNACSVVLQTWSMTIFEAIMMDRPVISINPFKKNYGDFVPIIADGGAVEVSGVDELQQWLLILTDPARPQTKKQLRLAKRACSRFIAAASGPAADKIANLLAKDH